MAVRLFPHQQEVQDKLQTGSILCGGVGSGKSIAALAYYCNTYGGGIKPNGSVSKQKPSKDLYIITTAKKRSSDEWGKDAAHFLYTPIVDSWNNIKKYADIKDQFFIFDEQRVIGDGTWAKTFIKIAKHNDWLLLSATPGDTWIDYIAVFIANGFYKNKTDFINQHVIYKRYTKFPMIDKYINTGLLIQNRNKVLVNMPFKRKTTRIEETINVEYNTVDYKNIMVTRWNSEENRPMSSASELCQALRKVVNVNPNKDALVCDILAEKKRAIIFYNYNYELDILRELMDKIQMPYSEWNGKKHEPVLDGDSWVYLVQYTAGCEGWNCITTDTIIFYSLNYSYRVMSQAAGRTDRINTPYENLYYYYLKTKSPIDNSILRALQAKRKFNESAFMKR